MAFVVQQPNPVKPLKSFILPLTLAVLALAPSARAVQSVTIPAPKAFCERALTIDAHEIVQLDAEAQEDSGRDAVRTAALQVKPESKIAPFFLRSEFTLHRYIYNEFVLRADVLFPVDIDAFDKVMFGVARRTGLDPRAHFKTYLDFKGLAPAQQDQIADAFAREAVTRVLLAGASSEELKESAGRLDWFFKNDPAARKAVLEVVKTNFPYHFANWSHHSLLTFTLAEDRWYLPVLGAGFLASAYATGDGFAGVLGGSMALSGYAISKLAFSKLAIKWRTHMLVRSVKKIFSNLKREEQAETNWAEWQAETSRLQGDTNSALELLEKSHDAGAFGDAAVALSYRLLNATNIVDAIRVIDLDQIKLLENTYRHSNKLGDQAKADLNLQLDTIARRLDTVKSEVNRARAELERAEAAAAHLSIDDQTKLAPALNILQNNLLLCDNAALMIEVCKKLAADLNVVNQTFTAGDSSRLAHP